MTIGLGLLELSAGASLIRKTSLFASGDHAYDDTPPFTSVKRCASPPRRSSSQTCEPLPSCRDDVNARYLPSGLQRGVLSASGDDVRRKFVVPSQLTIQISVS